VVDNRLGAGANTSTYVYSPTSTLKSMMLPNGVVTNYGYNSLDRLTSLVTKKTSTLASYTYTLRPEGNRGQVVELGGRTEVYGYDNAYRLSSETITGGSPNGTISYGYDAVGNRTSRTSSVAGIPTVASSTYDANDRLNGNTYNNNGDTTVAGGITYGYDFRDKLTSATGGLAMTYDGDGNRVSQTAGGTTTTFLVDDLNLTGYPQVVEELVSGVVQRTYTYGHDLISQNRLVSGTWMPSYHLADGLGSVRTLADVAGSATDSYTYDAFGTAIATTGSTPNRYRFTGEQFDANLGLYYLRARYYNQGGGRFWTRDTAGVIPENPREWNRYVYVANNSVNAVDPSGQNLFENASLNAKRETEVAAAKGVEISTERIFALQYAKLCALFLQYLMPFGNIEFARRTVAVGWVINQFGDRLKVVSMSSGNWYPAVIEALEADEMVIYGASAHAEVNIMQ